MSEGEDRLATTVAAGVLGVDATHRELLQSIVDNARAIFGSHAASIMLYDPDSHELVFEAVSGEGEDRILGDRFPAGTGIAGWVLASTEAVIVEEVARDPRFARDVAERSGYVPTTIMSAPLLHHEETLGVLNVLDPTIRRHSVGELDLLGKFAGHAAIALTVVRTGRRAKSIVEHGDREGMLVARLAAGLGALEGPRREAGLRLLAALDELLRD
jgi:GAF domain-containing protein